MFACLRALFSFNSMLINLVIEARASNQSASEFGSFSQAPTKKHLSEAYGCFIFGMNLSLILLNCFSLK